MSKTTGWARPWALARPMSEPMVRQGAWYPIVNQGATRKLVVEVRRHHVVLPRHLFEIRDRRPKSFTVVVRGPEDSNPARGTRSDLGRTYAVCPVAGCRVHVAGRPDSLKCPHCGHFGEVAWWETG